MSKNKKALIRYNTLDRCFSNYSKRYTIKDLINECNKSLCEFYSDCSISRSQIYADIAFMKSDQGWSIDLDETFKEGKLRYYRYEDKFFSINKISSSEKEALGQILLTVSRFKNQNLKDIVGVESLDELSIKVGLSPIELKNTNFVLFDTNDDYKGLHLFSSLFMAIKEERALYIDYLPFNGIQRKILMHPYWLREYKQRWYLHGRDNNNDAIFYLSLECIKKLEFADNTHFLKPSISAEDYFCQIVGNDYKPTPLTKIQLKISNDFIDYLEAKPIHRTQQIVKGENFSIINLEIKPNLDFISEILSLGASVQVLSPEHIRRNVKVRINQMIQLYK